VTRWSIGQTGAAAVPQLSHLVVIHTTSPVTNAQTNALFKLLLVDATGKEVRLDFPTLPVHRTVAGKRRGPAFWMRASHSILSGWVADHSGHEGRISG
jgi:hypothetical protein